MTWRYRFGGSKYKNKTAEHGGIKYHSGKEAAYAAELDLRKKAGDIASWERQVKIPLNIGRFHIANYYCDFLIYHNDGRKEFVEIKGFRTEVWRLKWKLFEALWSGPNIEMTVI